MPLTKMKTLTIDVEHGKSLKQIDLEPYLEIAGIKSRDEILSVDTSTDFPPEKYSNLPLLSFLERAESDALSVCKDLLELVSSSLPPWFASVSVSGFVMPFGSTGCAAVTPLRPDGFNEGRYLSSSPVVICSTSPHLDSVA